MAPVGRVIKVDEFYRRASAVARGHTRAREGNFSVE